MFVLLAIKNIIVILKINAVQKKANNHWQPCQRVIVGRKSVTTWTTDRCLLFERVISKGAFEF